MGRWLGRVVLGLLGLLVLAAVLWGASRLRGPTAEQRRAVAVFEQLPAPEGSNAFAALWLLQWDVPVEAQAAVVDEDAARLRSLPPPADAARPAAVAAFRSAAEGRWPDLAAELPPEPESCSWRETGCLARVRAERDAHARRLEAAAPLLERIDAVAGHEHYRNLLPATMDMPFPRLDLMPLALTRQALRFADGEADAALAGTCRALGGWRRLAGNSDSLLVAMFAATGIEGHAGLLAEMLAELPFDHPLPRACTEALAPLEEGELGICRAMRGEWESARTAFDFIDGSGQGFATSLLLDRKGAGALMAEGMAWPCGSAAAQALADDRRLQPEPRSDSRWRFECVANIVGCVSADVAAPAYVGYGHRMQDARAVIRLLRALAWMRDQAAAGDARGAEALLAALPAEPGGSGRPVTIDPDTGGLRVERYADRPGPWISLPLLPERREP